MENTVATPNNKHTVVADVTNLSTISEDIPNTMGERVKVGGEDILGLDNHDSNSQPSPILPDILEAVRNMDQLNEYLETTDHTSILDSFKTDHANLLYVCAKLQHWSEEHIEYFQALGLSNIASFVGLYHLISPLPPDTVYRFTNLNQVVQLKELLSPTLQDALLYAMAFGSALSYAIREQYNIEYPLPIPSRYLPTSTSTTNQFLARTHLLHILTKAFTTRHNVLRSHFFTYIDTDLFPAQSTGH